METRAYGVTMPEDFEAGVVKFEQWLRAGAKCEYCGRETVAKGDGSSTSIAFSIDHETPLSLGGAPGPANWANCCTRCNLAKAVMTGAQFRDLVSHLGAASSIDPALNSMAQARLAQKVVERRLDRKRQVRLSGGQI